MILSTFHRNLNRKKIENREVVSKTPSTNFSELMEFQITLAFKCFVTKGNLPQNIATPFLFYEKWLEIDICHKDGLEDLKIHVMSFGWSNWWTLGSNSLE